MKCYLTKLFDSRKYLTPADLLFSKYFVNKCFHCFYTCLPEVEDAISNLLQGRTSEAANFYSLRYLLTDFKNTSFSKETKNLLFVSLAARSFTEIKARFHFQLTFFWS